jgi:hypothetical protein
MIVIEFYFLRTLVRIVFCITQGYAFGSYVRKNRLFWGLGVIRLYVVCNLPLCGKCHEQNEDRT